jgi:hypothetical protein
VIADHQLRTDLVVGPAARQEPQDLEVARRHRHLRLRRSQAGTGHGIRPAGSQAGREPRRGRIGSSLDEP